MVMTVILCFGDPEECQGCGGWTRAEGGPFEGDPRFCSEDCYAMVAERSAESMARLACCGSCGFDNAEHAPWCGPGAGTALALRGYCPACGAMVPGMASELAGLVRLDYHLDRYPFFLCIGSRQSAWPQRNT
jgi:hypothetical protein